MANDDPVIARLAAIEAKLDVIVSLVQNHVSILGEHSRWIAAKEAEFRVQVDIVDELKEDVQVLKDYKTSQEASLRTRKSTLAAVWAVASVLASALTLGIEWAVGLLGGK